MTRRTFFGCAAAAVLSAADRLPARAGPERHERPSPKLAAARAELDLSDLPNFCAHEHWGSIDSIGEVPEGFRADVERGAVPKTPTGLFDILLDPYFKGLLQASGFSPDELARAAGAPSFQQIARQSPAEALCLLRQSMHSQELTGTFQCIRRGLLALYGVDISSADRVGIERLERALGRNYAGLFTWYRATMKKFRFTELIRPVHPEYYVREDSPPAAAEEARFTHTVMRIDPLLSLGARESPRRDALARMASIEPRDAASWRAFLERLFDLAARHGACGIKQLQAYTRSLEFVPRSDSEVVWSGDISPEGVRVFQDWVVHECSKQAHERGWAHQVHVGTHNLAQSSPLPLAALAERYPRMKIVLIHCWPFLAEAAWLAKYRPNISLDTCWLPILNPDYFRQAMAGWLTYVPTHKITCSHDATSIEMAVGSSLFTREILADLLLEQTKSLGETERSLKRRALEILHNNMVKIYGVGKPISVEELGTWSPAY
jgi:predicted TIM-barrel fold metal-dependent hydrolase